MPSTIIRDQKFDLTRNSKNAIKFFEDRISFIMQPNTLKEKLENPLFKIIDVRALKEYNKSHISNAINIPINKLDERIKELSRDQINIVYCLNEHCQSGDKVALTLAKQYYPVMLLAGGLEEWIKREYPIEK